MKEKNNELLLRDLCARLPYKTIVQIDGCGIWELRGVDHDNSAELRDRVIVWHGENQPSSKSSYPIIECKPYLFPLSSMTDEQEKEYNDLNCYELGCFPSTEAALDYLIKNHFDYRFLIDEGLAIDATELNIY